MGLNHVCMQGRLTANPELRRTNSGKAVTSFTIAVDRSFTKGEADFFDCVAWDKKGEFVSNHFTKGKMILVSGRLQKRKWTDKNGNNRETAEIVVDDAYFCDSKKDADNVPSAFQMNPERTNDFGYMTELDSGLPF